MSADGTGGVAESCLPQHGQIPQSFHQNQVGELTHGVPSEQTSLGAWQQAMREGATNAAAIKVDDAIVLTAGEDHAAAKSIVALRTNQSCL